MGESREDNEEDWEMERWSKVQVVEQLRQLPGLAWYTRDGSEATLHFRAEPVHGEQLAQPAGEDLDLAFGIVADMLPNGAISAVRFDLSRPSAARRIEGLGLAA